MYLCCYYQPLYAVFDSTVSWYCNVFYHNPDIPLSRPVDLGAQVLSGRQSKTIHISLIPKQQSITSIIYMTSPKRKSKAHHLPCSYRRVISPTSR